MANSLYDFATSEASSSQTGGVNTAEGQNPSTINDAMRAWKQLQAAWLDDLAGVNTVAGTATAVTVTASQGFTAYGTGAGQIDNGTVLALKMSAAATGAATLNVNAIGTKKIRRQGDSAIEANDWLADGIYLFRYDTAYDSATGAWVLLNPAVTLVNVAYLNVEAQTLAGGANVTVKDLGNLSGASITPTPGNRPIQKVTNNGAGSILPGSTAGSYLLEVINTTGAGAITTTGWTLKGDSFDTTTTSKFLCACVVTADLAVMTVTKVA